MSAYNQGIKAANGYIPIQDENGKKICEFSTIGEKDLMKSLLAPNMNMNLPIGSSAVVNSQKQVPICTDEEIYNIQNIVLKKLNQFNSDYSNYIIYKFNKSHTLPGDQTKKLNYTDDNGNIVYYSDTVQQTYETKYATTKYDSASQLPGYNDLINNIKTYSAILQASKLYRMDPANPMLQNLSDYYTPGTSIPTSEMKNNKGTALENRDPNEYLNPKHRRIVKMRSELDQKLMEFNNTRNSVFGESKLQMDASIYITILWTTLASAIVYFTFVHI